MKFLCPAIAGCALALSSCATTARATLENRFEAIGIPSGTAECMAHNLDERLNDQDLQDLARYTVKVSRADSTVEAVRRLMRFDNPRAVAAVGASAVECVTGFGL